MGGNAPGSTPEPAAQEEQAAAEQSALEVNATASNATALPEAFGRHAEFVQLRAWDSGDSVISSVGRRANDSVIANAPAHGGEAGSAAGGDSVISSVGRRANDSVIANARAHGRTFLTVDRRHFAWHTIALAAATTSVGISCDGAAWTVMVAIQIVLRVNSRYLGRRGGGREKNK